ncbi:MAG: diacylglycerol kinase [Microgenomates group bacterium Gr01-1014_16]|nr:MAG: diacylglycerol kinase [Microgenomates group bacterium Gr01-1014_16]
MLRRHTVSFYHALAGLFYALTTQPNFAIHLLLSAVAIVAGYSYQISTPEWLILAVTISFGLVIELINTAIESTVDLITDQFHSKAKIAKDVSAAAMLVYAIGAVIIALIIFIPKLLNIEY